MTIRHRPVPRFPLALALVAAMGFAATLVAQDRLKSMPGYDQYQKMSKEVTGAVKPGALSVTWKDAADLRVREGRQDVPVRRRRRRLPPRRDRRRSRRRPGRPGRARRHADGRTRPAGGVHDVARRQAEGVLPRSQPLAERRRRHGRSAAHDRRQREGPHQVRHGELGLRRGTGPDDRDVVVAGQHARSAYYRFDEKQVPDYYLQLDQTKLYSRDRHRGLSEGRPAQPDRRPVRLRRRREEDAPGSTCATASRSTTPSSGTTSTTSRWSPDGTELLFNRTNRRQNILELVGRQPGDRRVPRRHPRGVADRLGGELPRAWRS